METSIGSGMVALAIAGVLISIVARVAPHKKNGNGNGAKNGEETAISRPEFEQHCRNEDTSFHNLRSDIASLNDKLDGYLANLADQVQNHEKRIGIIEARHHDYTGDPHMGGPGGSGLHPRAKLLRDRRGASKQDTGERRRSTDQNGLGDDETEIAPG